MPTFWKTSNFSKTARRILMKFCMYLLMTIGHAGIEWYPIHALLNLGGEKLSLKVTQIKQIIQFFAETLGRCCLEIEATLLRRNAYRRRTSPTWNFSSPDPHARLCFIFRQIFEPEFVEDQNSKVLRLQRIQLQQFYTKRKSCMVYAPLKMTETILLKTLTVVTEC